MRAGSKTASSAIRRSVAQQRVAEANRAIAAAERAIVMAVSSLLRTFVEVDLHRRPGQLGRMLVYVEGHPLSSFEPEFACDAALRSECERDAIAAAFGDGPAAQRRLEEFYRLARTLEALHVLDKLKDDGGVIRLFPSVGPRASDAMERAA